LFIRSSFNENTFCSFTNLETDELNVMYQAREINELIEWMKDSVTEENKNTLIPKLLKEAVEVWWHYKESKLKLNLTEIDLQLHLKMMKRLWDLAEQYNVAEKVPFPNS